MHSSLKISAALLVNLSLFCHEVFAQLPPISFETYQSQPVDLSSPDPWEPIYGDATVTPAGQGFGGGKALKIGVDPQEEAWLRKPITWNPAEQIAFIDFRIKPAATPAGSQASFLANGTQLAFQLPPNSSAGELWVLHGNDDAVASPPGSPLPPEKWYQSAGTFTVPQNSPVSTTWLRATLRHDYQRKIWDLFIDGKLAAVNLGFEGRGSNLTELEFFGSKAGDTLIDNLEANPANMLFPDADKDGLPDAWEIANGSNSNLYDRDAIDPVTGKSFLNKYLDSLWNAGSPGTPVNGSAGLGNVGTIPPLTILDSHQPVGALKGQFAVGGDGAATYTMPLDIPKGRAGMEPKLSLNYSSNAGNGPMGVGWSIGGLQKITRGPSSLKKDGIADGADFDANDRYFLDGERLVCISGNYGADGSEYRTEMDSFARIKAVGQMVEVPPVGPPVNLGPASWTVETKSGLKITLGNSAGSKVQVDTLRILSWLVTQVADTTGRNAYEVDYCDNAEAPAAPTSSGRYPLKVRYTIDPTVSDNGFCSMNFDYEGRPDVSSGYVRGVKQEANLRLRQVAVRTGTYLNHAYNFFYTTSQQTGRSLLYGVDKEAADGSRVPATSFQWETLSHSAPKWIEAGHLDFNEYGSGQDSGSDMASSVSVNSGGTELHLTGNAWRSYPIDNPAANPPTPYYTVTANTRLQFDYWTTAAPAVPKWGMIGLDENASTANPKRLFKLIGTNGGTPPAACYSDSSGTDLNDYNYTTPGSWKTVKILVGQHYTGQMKYLALVNDDNSVSNNDGAGESRFRNIKIYEDLNANSAADAPVRIFDQAIAAPRIIGGTNEDLGVRIQDLNADGLPDIAYNLLHSKSTGTGAVALQTFGQVLLNTGSGFVNDTTLLPGDTTLKLPSTIPTGNLPGAGEGQFASSQAIYPVPVDIDGDGRLDYSYAKNLTRDGNGYFTCEHGYLSSKTGVWADLPDYTHDFKSTCPTSQKRFSHFEHIDLDSDGDLDLVVHPYGASLALRTGVLNDPAHNPGGDTFPILGASGDNKGLAYLNRFDDGGAWEIAPKWRLPEPLKIPGFNSNGGEVGRGMQDLNADGRPDIYSNLWPVPDEVWHNDPDSTYISPKTGTLSYWVPQPKVNPNSNPVVPPLTSLPEDVTNTSGQDIGTRLVDINGDGHFDLLKALGETIEAINVGVHLNKGGVGWAKLSPPPATPLAPVPWQPEENFNTVDKRNEMKEQGTSFTDLNADGLVDFVVSKTTRNTVFFNTGSDWWPESIELENGDDVPNIFWVGGGPASGGMANGKWELPFRIYPNTVAATEGIRHAMLVDLNGDGVSDLIGDMKSPIPRIWINQAKPERIISFTDGFAASIQVDTYARLNDPTPVPNSLGLNRRVYDKTPVSALLPAHVSLCDGRWVVARYSEPDGNGGRRYRSQYYGDLRYDRANEASLGFGKIEIHDELTRGKSVTQTRRDYPFAGSPDVSESFVYVTNGLPLHTDTISPGYYRVSQDTATYAELATTVGTGVPLGRACSETRRPVQTGSVSKKWDVDGTLMSEITTSQEFDAHELGFGFVKKSTVKALDNTTTITENTYGHTIDVNKWWLGRLSLTTVKKRESLTGADVVVKNSSFAYNLTTGLLNQEIAQPGHSLFVQKTYGHDPYGNIISTAVTANTSATGSQETRVTTSEWDTTNQRFPTKETSTVGFVKFAYSQKRALLLSSTDLDDRQTTFTYDVFGTKLATNFPDHTRTAEITRFVSNADLPSSVAQKIGTATLRWARSAQASATPWSTVYFDTLGREIVTETVVMTAFDGSSATFANQFSVTLYDARGRKHKTSTPFLAGEDPYWTEFIYDDLDRPVKTIRPDGEDEGVLKYGPANLGSGPVTWVKTYNAKNHELQRWTDQHDRLVQSSDETDRATTFAHDIEGRLTSVFIGSECQLRNRWDKMGNKVAVWDMSSGGSDPGASFSDPEATLPNPASYHYSTSVPNGFGEVRSATTPHGTVTTQYDSAGRVWKVIREGTTYTTTYKGDAPGKGKPESVDSTGTINGYQEFFVYGSDLGKPHEYGKIVEAKKRQSGPEALYISRTKYNAVGLVMDEFFDGTTGTDDDAHVRHEYDSEYGSYKVRTKLFDDATQISTVLSEFVSVKRSGSEIVSKENLTHGVLRETRTDARTGRILKIRSTRNGESQILQDLTYTWDSNGNLETRTDMKAGTAGKTESFSTDHLDRLTSSTISGESTVPYTYDLGNKGNLIAKNGNTFNYTGYRVTSATIKGQSRTYSYDNAGHVINDGKREYEWTSFGQLKSVEQDSCPALETFAATNTYAPAIPGIALRAIYAASQARSEFQFDAAGSRSQQTLVRSFNDGSAARVITRYIGSYQVEEHASQPVSGSYTTVRNLHRHQLGSSLLTRDHKTSAHPDGPSSTLRLALVLTDHIGSTDVVVRADWTGSAWNVASGAPKAERQSFDAWGQRRDGTGWSELHPASGSTRKTSAMDDDRGFTGHEMLDDFGIVHMNGRIYDSELGRFLSPDPYVQVPEYSQNFNRYSYVLNNPLSLTDPSGNLIHGLHVAGLLEVREAGQRYLQSQPEVAQIVMIVVAVALWWTGVGVMGLSAVQTGAFVGGTTGALRADISGGNAGDILRGAAVGAVQGAIASGVLHGFGASAAETATQAGTLITGSLAADRAINIAGHAVLGGLSNAALGGKFQDGFLSGLAGAAVAATGVYDLVKGDGYGAVAARTAMAGIVGGTASAIGGGKFANGAWTAAFQFLLSSAAESLNTERLVGRFQQELTGSCVAASCRNAIEAMGGNPPSEERIRQIFDEEAPLSINWSVGNYPKDAPAVLARLGYQATYQRTSLNGLLKLTKPAILEILWPNGSGHAVLLESSSYKRFLFIFKYDRRYNIVDPGIRSDRSIKPSAKEYSASELKSDYYGYGGKYTKRSVVFD